MRTLALALLFPLVCVAQGLSPAEQRALQQQVRQLQQQVNQLQQGADAGGGLKTEDYANQNTDSRKPASQPANEGLPPGMEAELRKQMEELKKMQGERNKLINELEKDL